MGFIDSFLKAGHFEEVWNDPSAWSPSAMFFGPGDRVPVTGKTLTAEDIMYCSVVWRCVNLIADTVAKLPRYLYRETETGTGERAIKHPLYRIASRAPNKLMTKFEFDQLAVFNACMWGQHFAEVKRDQRGIAQTMWILDPSRMSAPTYNKLTNEFEYKYNAVKGGTLDFTSSNLHRFFRHSYDGVTGAPITSAALDAIALCRSFIEYSGRFFQGDATPPWVIMHDDNLSDAAKKKIRESITNQTKGLSKRFQFAILDAGLKAQGLGDLTSNRDAQLTEQQRYVIAEIARYFGVPLHKLAELTRSTNNNIAQQAIEFYTDCIDAWLTIMGESYSRDLIPWSQQGLYYIEFDPTELLYADPIARDENARKNVQAGLWTPNEGRATTGKQPDPNPFADMLQFPTTHAPGGVVLKAPEPPKDEKEDEEKPKEKEEDEDTEDESEDGEED